MLGQASENLPTDRVDLATTHQRPAVAAASNRGDRVDGEMQGLGVVQEQRGNLDAAEERYNEALAMFRHV